MSSLRPFDLRSLRERRYLRARAREIQPRNCSRTNLTADGTIRTMSMIDGAFFHLPTAGTRDFHSRSVVFENLGERCIPSDHAAVRIVSQKPTIRCNHDNRIARSISELPGFCSILKQINDDHQHPDDPSVALAVFRVILEKARKRTVHELLRKTPSRPGVKLLTASTASRAYRNRHLGTLMHCCEAWELVGKCFDQCSFECIDSHWLSQIIPSLTRERIAEREAEICNLPWTQTEKTLSLQSAGVVFAPGAPRSQCSATTLLPMKMATLWKMKTNRAGGCVNVGVRCLKRVLKASGTITMRVF